MSNVFLYNLSNISNNDETGGEKNMLYRTIYKRIARKTGIDKRFVMIVLKAYSDILQDAIMDGETLPLPHIGRFKVIYRSHRQSNLGGKKTFVPAGKILSFCANDKLRKFVNRNPYVQFSKVCHPCRYYPPSKPA